MIRSIYTILLLIVWTPEELAVNQTVVVQHGLVDRVAKLDQDYHASLDRTMLLKVNDRIGKPLVVAIYGPSCSGKTTIGSELYSSLNGIAGMRAPSIDAHFKFDKYDADHTAPTIRVDGHLWKDWETADAIDWDSQVKDIQEMIERHRSDRRRFLVVEGFLLFDKPESRALFDIAIVMDISKEEAWRRRLARAQSMLGLPEGIGENTNYEVLPTYITSDVDAEERLAIAKAKYPAEGDYAWLKMYFEDVIWPAAQQHKEKAQLVMKGMGIPVKTVSASGYANEEEWMVNTVRVCKTFANRAAKLRSPRSFPCR
eukprot:gnl/TRDRNA2_/TRDRNA2_203607_c0_seq1.p1 gnl/TRDRNA2_/TRDRNA2_203607_c0~~gnl/TRDRNA2_/TRDRNA2_203607_c0_seq1.p1  ORF type:complete len:313 (+),score=47.19 gnl/TRDRNA2_/TRDRNA2_203607_c0_seq1:105-1043(+)